MEKPIKGRTSRSALKPLSDWLVETSQETGLTVVKLKTVMTKIYDCLRLNGNKKYTFYSSQIFILIAHLQMFFPCHFLFLLIEFFVHNQLDFIFNHLKNSVSP